MQTYSKNSLYWGTFSPDSGMFHGEYLFLDLQNGNYITSWCDAFLNYRSSCKVNPTYLLHDIQTRLSWFAEHSVYGTGHTSSSSSFPAKQTCWLLLEQIHSQLLGPALCWVQPSQSLLSRFLFKFLLLSYLQWTFSQAPDYLPFSNPTNISFSIFFLTDGSQRHKSMQKRMEPTVHFYHKAQKLYCHWANNWNENLGWKPRVTVYDPYIPHYMTTLMQKSWQQNLCFSHPYTFINKHQSQIQKQSALERV